MSDRELLELAAKAAKIKYNKKLSTESALFTNNGTWWSPFTNGEQAIELLVKLKINIKHELQSISFSVSAGDNGTAKNGMSMELYGADPLLATYRAIVRAAARMQQCK